MNQKIVIDESSDDPDWVRCFTVDFTCNIVQGFIRKSPALVENSLFFSLGIFDGLGLLVALIVLVVVAIPILFIGNVAMAIKSIPVVGIFLCVGIILGLLYTVYRLLENILFELFLINLPW